MGALKARFKNKATINELIQFENEFELPTMDFKEPVKKKEVKVVYYSSNKKKKKDSGTGLF